METKKYKEPTKIKSRNEIDFSKPEMTLDEAEFLLFGSEPPWEDNTIYFLEEKK